MPRTHKLEIDEAARIVGIKEMVPPVKIPVDDGLRRLARRPGRLIRPGRKRRVERRQHGHDLWLLKQRSPWHLPAPAAMMRA